MRGRVFVDGFAVFRLGLMAAGVAVMAMKNDGAVDDADDYYYWNASASFVCAW